MRAEFVDHSANAALATMSATPHLNHVLVMTGGIGREEIRAFTQNGSFRKCRKMLRSIWSL